MLLLLLVVVSLMATVIPVTAATLINGAGATFPYPLYTKWFSEYAKIDRDVKFKFQAIGSSEGIRLITAQSVDFGATDRYLSDDELKAAPGKLLHIPTVMGAVVITYNLPGIGSGTTNIFTDYLSSVNKEWAGKVGKGTSVEWPVGFGGKGNEGVASLVKKTKFALGYVELAHAMQNNLCYASLKNREGVFVDPAIKSITAAVGAVTQMPADYRTSLVNQPGRESYPVVGFTWLLVYEQQKDKIKGKKLVDFITWSLHNGQKLAAPLGYAPLPENVTRMVEKTIKEIKY
jgi:phosphate transport system substrate-binding protein